MPQLETVFNPCPKCSAAFTNQRTHFCKEIIRYQRDYFAQQHEIKSLQAELKNALQRLQQETHRAASVEREACAKVCEQQMKIFASTQYKAGQPLSSLGERHVAASCAHAIRAREQSCSAA
jgi:glycerol-3-phosphate cytidylyltransferase-like family protein